ncbi:MAG: nucleoside 2-deoxyribosyltransferase [Candidatus Aenigmatarchaeota archaeon]
MKIFIAFRFTGEDDKELKENIQGICSSLEKAGHEHFCSYWKEDYYRKNNFTKKQILEHAFEELDKSDAVLAFVNSEERSEGMLLEIGYALAKGKRFILAIRKGIRTTFIHQTADQIIEFESMEELFERLRKIR